MKKELDEKLLENVNGGRIRYSDTTLYYERQDISKYKILDYDKMVEILNAQEEGTSENRIMGELISAGCITARK